MWGHDTAIRTFLYLILLSIWFHEVFKLIFPKSSSWSKTMYAEHWRELGSFPIFLVQSFCGALLKGCLLEYATVFPSKNEF